MRNAPAEALQTLDPSPAGTVTGLEGALRGNPISPYRWLELGEGYEQAGDVPKARLALGRAEQLGANLPEVWIRTAAFYFRRGETDRALRASARAQAISDEADALLFQYYDHFVEDVSLVAQALNGNERAMRAYFRYLMASNQVERAAAAWQQLSGHEPCRALAIEYVGFLLKARRFTDAEAAWIGVIPSEARTAYPAAEHIYNGGFERDPSGSMLDWNVTPTDAADISLRSPLSREGKFSLCVRFHGTDNLHFENVFQDVIVKPAAYRLSSWIKTDGVTTDEGIRLCVSDAEAPGRFGAQTDAIRGTNEWTKVSKILVIPAETHLLKVTICRLPSARFDNKISGTAWMDGVSLVREP